MYGNCGAVSRIGAQPKTNQRSIYLRKARRAAFPVSVQSLAAGEHPQIPTMLADQPLDLVAVRAHAGERIASGKVNEPGILR